MDYNQKQLDVRTRVNADNFEAAKVAVKEILQDWNHLVAACEKYPVELCFAQLRYVYCSEKALKNIYTTLLRKIAEHKLLMLGMRVYQ